MDASGTIRWVEVCYCREFLGVAMDEEIGYFEEYLTDITIADARSPAACEGYPVCNDCDCTNKVRFRGEPFLDYLRRIATEPDSGRIARTGAVPRDGWAGAARCVPEETVRNHKAGRRPVRWVRRTRWGSGTCTSRGNLVAPFSLVASGHLLGRQLLLSIVGSRT